MKWAMFKDMYVANWRGPWLDGGISEWIAKIERSEINADTMRRTLESCLDHRMRMAKDSGKIYDGPRLGEVMTVYRRIEGEPVSREYTGGWRLKTPCGQCDGGYLWMFVDMNSCEMVDIRKPRSAYVGPIKALRSICTCQVDALGRPGELTQHGIPYFAKAEHADMALAKWEGREYKPVDRSGPGGYGFGFGGGR